MGLLVLAAHGVALEVLANRLRTPFRTGKGQPSVLHAEWVDPKAVLTLAKPADRTNLRLRANVNRSALLKQSSDAELSDLELAGFQSIKPSDADRNQGWNPLLYRSSPEVDTRTAPRLDWAVNRQAMPKGVFSRLVITIWISAEGVVDHFELEQQQPSGNWVSSALSSFQTTVMEPATLAGVPVASTMTVEISLDDHTQ